MFGFSGDSTALLSASAFDFLTRSHDSYNSASSLSVKSPSDLIAVIVSSNSLVMTLISWSISILLYSRAAKVSSSSLTALALWVTGPSADTSVAMPSFSSLPWVSKMSFSVLATSVLSWLTVLNSVKCCSSWLTNFLTVSSTVRVFPWTPVRENWSLYIGVWVWRAARLAFWIFESKSSISSTLKSSSFYVLLALTEA